MQKIKEFFANPIIQMALAVGVSILVLDRFSDRVFAEPLSKLELALPGLIGVLFQGLASHRKGAWYSRPIVGILLVLLTTALIIFLNA